MKKFLERYPWVQQAGCGVLICALLLSICLPLMGMRSAEQVQGLFLIMLHAPPPSVL